MSKLCLALSTNFQRASLVTAFILTCSLTAKPADANRLVYLDQQDPFYVGLSFPKLITPQSVGEPEVEAVVVLAIDDMRDPQRYETFLRPILNRLKQIDGRASLSIMCNAIDPSQPQLQAWLNEGLSLEVHTLSHPCPLLAKGNFSAALETYQGCVDLLNHVAGNKPVAFRMPCCDSMNSPSPRFYAEIFNQTNSLGQFLSIDSSIMNITTPKDQSLSREWVVGADGRERFRKYLPARTNAATRVSMGSFVTTIEDYPYPYVIGKLCWEFPCVLPSDWEAQNLQGPTNATTVGDWKAALDVTVRKQGVFNLIFHPHGWIRNEQVVEFINYASSQYGKRVKFLNFREAQERLNKSLLAGNPLRRSDGRDNGVRLVDLNNDGYLDVIVGNERLRRTRLWQPEKKQWTETDFPAQVVSVDPNGSSREAGVKFGILHQDGFASFLLRTGGQAEAWHFDGEKWVQEKSLLAGLELQGKPILTQSEGRDRGVLLRDLDNDGFCEFLVGNESQNAVFKWAPEEKSWKILRYGLPEGTAVVDAQGQDRGLRFADLNNDGYADLIFSNDQAYSVDLFTPELFLGFQPGWSRRIITGKRGDGTEIPMISRGGRHPNNGAWFHSRHLWVQNEETATMPDLVDRRSFELMFGGLQPPPQSPQESLASIRVRPGFQVELVAQEPLVNDPIAFEWGADGKLWVAEMVDYPLGLDGQGKPGGIVRFLEDTHGDGRYDKSTVFLDGLNFPTGVMPWRKGVLVSAAPDIFYAEDSDGDGKADLRKVLFTGFVEGNQQHRVNGFEYGLDNWVYGANGDSGGKIQANPPLQGRVNQKKSGRAGWPVDLRGHDFRFRPDTGEFETVAGQTQFGRHRDDWGNWFGNNNPSWAWHFFLPEQYLRRNPFLAVKTTKRYLADYEDSLRVFPISRLLQRFNDIGMANHVTSGNSVTPYRDELFGPDFATSLFVSEPVHNTVHREMLQTDGVTFQSHRALDEQDREFLASTDSWFRPTMMRTGPDGALYIADMYRLVLEHPQWIPPDTQKQFNLRAGDDQGRIYRVYPEGAKLRRIPRLDKLSSVELAAALDSPNGWQRDTAQRLLVQAGDKAAAKPLQQLVRSSPRAQTRLQALCTLDGLSALDPDVVEQALQDSHPAIREHAVRLSENFLDELGRAGDRANPEFTRWEPRWKERPSLKQPSLARLEERLLSLVDDPSIRVRYQLAFFLGEWDDPRAAEALVRLADKDPNEQPVQTAILSSAGPHISELLNVLAAASAMKSPRSELFGELLGLAAATEQKAALQQGLTRLSTRQHNDFAEWQMAALAGFLDALERRGSSLTKLRESASPGSMTGLDGLKPLFAGARRATQAASSASRPDNSGYLVAIRLLGRGLDEQDEDARRLGALLRPEVDTGVQQAALNSLKRMTGGTTASVILDHWKRLTPTIRSEALNVLFTRPEWISQLLSSIESGNVGIGEVGALYQQRLSAHNDSTLRERAQKVFAQRERDRKKVIEAFASVSLLIGQSDQGAAIYRQNCATCHRLKGEGTELGPDLGTVADKPTAVILTGILDPNQAVEARYLGYTAVTGNGREVTGVLTASTPASITLRAAGGTEEVILRTDLKDLSSSGLSLMPEGLETALTPQSMADLISFIRAR